MNFSEIWIFTDEEKRLVSSLVSKGREEQKRNEKFAIIDFDDFYSLFEESEIAVMQKFLTMDPARVDYKLPFLGAGDVPENIVAIPDQTYYFEGKTFIIPCQYLLRKTLAAYEQLNEAMQAAINKKLLVGYGYRSPARQVFIFFDILLRLYDFDFEATIKRVALPDYSEHVCSQKQAIDFKTADGGNSDMFDKTAEYGWLQENAQQFHFFESYPKDNNLGMMYEPWHWHHEP